LIKDKPEQAVDLYTRQCSINVNAKDLAVMAATLANAGKNPVTKKQVIDQKHVPGILAVMSTAGLYDDSGKWLFVTGLPAKSGVGGGIIAAGLTSIVIGLIVQRVGWKWITLLMPPAVLAMTVIAVGLLLAPVAFGQVQSNPMLAVITFGVGVLAATKARRGTWVATLPIMLAIVAGYIVALITGQVNLQPVIDAPLFSLPRFFMPEFDLRVVMPMVLVTATAVLAEHIGHLQATGTIIGRNYMPRAGISLIADGLSNAVSWSGTPSVTYSENIGVFALTRIYSLRVMKVAGLLALAAGFFGKLSPIILSIPSGVLGGATFLLFGLIAWAGFNMFLAEKIELSEKSNQIIVASMGTMMIASIIVEYLRPIVSNITTAEIAALPASVAGAVTTLQNFAGSMTVGGFALPGLVAVALLGILLNLVLNWSAIRAEFQR
jgi:xanthine/uracil permease